MAIEFGQFLLAAGNVDPGSAATSAANILLASSRTSTQNQRNNRRSPSAAQLPSELTSTGSLPPLKPELDLSDRMLFAVYCFCKNFVGSASGNNAVAIDNKIEQAMDLVKSHLMFAVREEVEVLKEKIAELMDRINQLEVENSILKANASPETIELLPKLSSSAAASSAPSSQASVGAGPANGQPS